MAEKKKPAPRKRTFDEREPSGQHRHLKDTVKSSADAAKGDSILHHGTKTRKNAAVRKDIKDEHEGFERIQRRIDDIDKEIKRLRRKKIDLLKSLAVHDFDKKKYVGFQVGKEGRVNAREQVAELREAEEKILGDSRDLDDEEVTALLNAEDAKDKGEPEAEEPKDESKPADKS